MGYRVPKEWSGLPDDLSKIKSKAAFKRKCKRYLFSSTASTHVAKVGAESVGKGLGECDLAVWTWHEEFWSCGAVITNLK